MARRAAVELLGYELQFGDPAGTKVLLAELEAGIGEEVNNCGGCCPSCTLRRWSI